MHVCTDMYVLMYECESPKHSVCDTYDSRITRVPTTHGLRPKHILPPVATDTYGRGGKKFKRVVFWGLRASFGQWTRLN
jgi:hypothetical protein